MEGQKRPRGGSTRIEPAIAITRGRIEKLTVHEVSDYELDAIQAAAEQGSSEVASIVLNFAIALLTLSVSLLFSLIASTIESPRSSPRSSPSRSLPASWA